MSTDETVNGPRPFDLFVDGEMEVEGRMPWSSNATFLVNISAESTDPTDTCEVMKGIYKPLKGERPLWDFPNGLFRREAAAFELAHFLGWDVIPRTVVRDGPFGLGSVQWFVSADFEQHYFTMLENRPELHDQLRTLAVFDILANNADRKGGHVLVLPGDDGTPDTIWGIDQGLCFHDEPKLRTVMWDFATEKIPAVLLADIERLATLDAGSDPFGELLIDDECGALVERAQKLLRKPVFPRPTSNYAYPWPMV